MSITLGSLCSGIGGLELGVERALRARTVWQAEIDPHASAVLAHRWPGVTNIGDVRDVAAMTPVDILAAGYPCQPFSTAGRRKGTDDPRHLWPAVHAAVAHLGPRLVILENVRGHLTLGFDQVLGDLAGIGYDAEWRVVRASDVGCCHQRARLFVAAYPNGVAAGRDGAAAPRAQGTGTQHGDRPGDGRGATAPDATGAERRATQPDALPAATHRPAEPRERRGPDAADANGEGLEGSQPAPRRDLPAGGTAADATHVGRQRDGRARDRETGPTDSRFGPYAAAVRRQEAWHGPAPDPTTDGRLNPAFVEWMMGYPAGWVTDVLDSRNAALRCLGNAVVPQVAEAFCLGLLDEEVPSAPVTRLLPTPRATRGGSATETAKLLLDDPA